MKPTRKSTSKSSIKAVKQFTPGYLTYNKDGSIDKRCSEYKKTVKVYRDMVAHGEKIKLLNSQVSKMYISTGINGLRKLGAY